MAESRELIYDRANDPFRQMAERIVDWMGRIYPNGDFLPAQIACDYAGKMNFIASLAVQLYKTRVGQATEPLPAAKFIFSWVERQSFDNRGVLPLNFERDYGEKKFVGELAEILAQLKG